MTSVALGASIIEKHFCISREIDNPDASFSMTPEEYRALVDEVRAAQKAVDVPTYGVTAGEESSVVFRRSIFCVKDIAAGEALTEENIRVIRPGYGLKPKYYKDILGLCTDRPLERGTPVSFDVLQKGAVLFLTNSDNTEELYQWLKEQEPLVYIVTNKLTAEMAKELQPSFVVSYNYQHQITNDVSELLTGRIINLHDSLLPLFRENWQDIREGKILPKELEGELS